MWIRRQRSQYWRHQTLTLKRNMTRPYHKLLSHIEWSHWQRLNRTAWSYQWRQFCNGLRAFYCPNNTTVPCMRYSMSMTRRLSYSLAGSLLLPHGSRADGCKCFRLLSRLSEEGQREGETQNINKDCVVVSDYKDQMVTTSLPCWPFRLRWTAWSLFLC